MYFGHKSMSNDAINNLYSFCECGASVYISVTKLFNMFLNKSDFARLYDIKRVVLTFD